MKKLQTHSSIDAADPTWRPLYSLGSIAALLYVIMILIPLVLLFVAPQPPATGGTEVLTYIMGHKLVYLIELVSFVGLSVPALVVFTAVAVSLKNADKTIALIGGLMGVVSETIALALGSSPQSLSGTLIGLSSQYAGATSDTARQALSAAAEGVVAGTNAVSWAGILTALGIMVLSIGMLRGLYGRAVAWIGIATGAAGVVLEALRPQVGAVYGIYGVLLPLWFVLVGIALNREARRENA